jgi:hypothetical protein
MKSIKSLRNLAYLAIPLALYACGGGGNQSGNKSLPVNDVPVSGITAGSTYSFDIGTVANGKYYVTDRNNKALDVIDISTNTFSLLAAGSFAGCAPTANCVGANNGLSGPNGINAVGSLLYVGDVNFVRIVDPMQAAVVKSIRVGSGGFRADEGCYDAADNLFMIEIPDADQPYAVFINTVTQTLVATVNWVNTDGTAAGGNEACAYDAGTKRFIVNNDATLENPRGETDAIPAADIVALAAGSTVNVFSLPNVARYPLGTCDPTGLDLGPGTDMIVECRQGNAGDALTAMIMNRTNGAILATLPAGGGDQVAYDAASNKYYIGGSRWHTSGKNDKGGGCSATNPCDPRLFIVDASTKQIVSSIPIGNNAHSVAVDPSTGDVFVPYSSATAPAGCPACAGNNFVNGGISIFQPF